MRQENSVLFALADLRSLESDRIAQEERVAEERRIAAEQQRAAEEARRSEAAAARRREQEERDELARALRQQSGQNQQLEADVRQLRSLLTGALPAPPPARRGSPIALVVAAVAVAAVAGGILVASLQHPTVRERVVYVSSPPTPTPAPSLSQPAPRPPVASSPTSVPHSPKAQASHHPQKHTAPPAKRDAKLPTVDDCDGKDPLCGTTL